MKKIAAFILSAIMILANLNVYAESSLKLDRQYIFLNYLNIIDGYGAGAFEQESGVTRSEFAYILVRMQNIEPSEEEAKPTSFLDVSSDYWNSKDIVILNENNIMSGFQGSFEPDRLITANEAVTAIVNLLGYGEYANVSGGYPLGYNKVASDLGLLKNVSTGTRNISCDEAVTLICNALDTNVAGMEISGEDVKRVLGGGVTLLNKYFGLYKDKGIVDGSYKTKLTTGKGTAKGIISIDGLEYYDAADASDMLGYEIEFYYSEKNGERTLEHFAESEKNNLLELKGDDIESFEKNVYYYRQGQKEYKAKLSKNSDVLYNGQAISSGFTDYIPKNGYVTLIDNNDDEVYEVVIIYDFKSVYAENIVWDGSDCIIYDKYRPTEKIVLEENGDYNIEIFDSNLNKTDWEKVKSGVVISIAQGEKNVKMIVSELNVSGKVTSAGEEDGKKKISLDGEAYYIASDYLGIMPSVSDNVTLYLDYNSAVVMAQVGSSETIKTGYLIKAYKNDDDKNELKIFTENGRMERMVCNAKLSVNGEKTDENKLIDLLKVNAVSGDFEQLIRYQADSDGNIKKLFLPKSVSEAKNNFKTDGFVSIYQDSSTARPYKSGPMIFDGKLSVGKNTKVFVVPVDRADEKEFYYTDASYFVNDTYYNMLAYRFSSQSADADVVVAFSGLQGTIATRATSMLVDGIELVVGENDELKYEITGMYNGTMTTFLTESDSVEGADKIEPGDIVRFSFSSESYINAIEHVFDESKHEMVEGANPTSSNYVQGRRFLYGAAYKKIDNTIWVSSAEDVSDIEYSNLEIVKKGGQVYVYDSKLKKGKAKNGDFSEILDYTSAGSNSSKILIHTSFGETKMIVIYK